jgi:hypothetical protein
MRALKIAALMAATALTSAAYAADMPVKAPPAPNPLFTGYPYGTTGLFYGIYTEGGGGPVKGTTTSVAGASSADLVELSAGVGITVGWAWGTPNSNIAYSVEGDLGWDNFNGNTAGFSAGGPLEGEFRFVAYTPLANFQQFLPNAPGLGAVPPFNVLPAGVTASHTQLGIMAGVHWNDISPDFAGLANNREFRAAPMIGLVQMEQLSNNMALRTYVKNVFPGQGVCIGPIPTKQACGGLGNQVLVGASLLY